jgi:hypothetical protein
VTAPAASSTGRGGRRGGRLLPFVLLGIGLLAVTLLAGQPNEEGEPYDPASNGETGTKALVGLLTELGADVDVSDRRPGPQTDVVFVLPGVLPPEREASLRRFAESGGVVVVADPTTELNPPRGEAASFGGLVDEVLEQRECTIAALAGARTIKPEGGFRFRPPPGAAVCYTRGGDAYVVDVAVGDGHIVSVGGARLFTNELLGSDDNAVLAAALLAPTPGTRVLFVEAPEGTDPGDGPDLTSLIGIGVRLALLQLVVAFVVYAFWRGRRLGRPVIEPQPVELGGSELVDAVGNLLQQSGSPSRAAAILQGDLRRELCERLGLAPDAPPDVIADAAFTRTGADRDPVLLTVVDTPVADEAGLLGLAQAVDAVRQEVLHGSAV